MRGIRLRRNFIASLLATLICLPSAASAQTTPPDDATRIDLKRQQAKSHFDAGTQAMDREDWARATDEFRKAYELSGEHEPLRNLALAEIQLGQVAPGANHLLQYLSMRPAGVSDADLRQLSEYLAITEKQLGRLTFVADVERARVWVDGVEIGTTPLPMLYVRSGTHQVRAEAVGRSAYDQSVTVQAGQAKTLRLQLEVQPNAETPAGWGQTSPPEPPPGRQPALTPAPAHQSLINRTTVSVSLLALSAAAGATWFGLHRAADAAERDARGLGPEALASTGPGGCQGASAALPACVRIAGRVSDAERWHHLATVAEFATFGLAAGALATFVFWPKHRVSNLEQATGVRRVLPWTTARTAGLALEGQF